MPLNPLFNEEPVTEYGPGGFHFVAVGDKFKSRYVVKRKLGWGQYSIVWLAWDEADKRFVALKMISSNFSKNPQRPWLTPEVSILSKIHEAKSQHPGRQHVLTLYDYFELNGPNGTHDCLVLEVLGQTIEALRLEQEKLHGARRLPIATVKRVTRQILLALDYLHTECGVIHTDLKPWNILTTTQDINSLIREDLAKNPPQLIDDSASDVSHIKRYKSQPLSITTANESLVSVKIADFGTANWVEAHFLTDIQPAALRAPEVILHAPWSTSADIWNLGCLVAEFVHGKQLFGPWPPDESYPREDAHLCEMMGLLGGMPNDLLSAGERTDEFFDDEGNLLLIEEYTHTSIEKVNTDRMLPETPPEEVQSFTSFLSCMLRLRPSDRLSAIELLQHVWLNS